MNFLYKTPCSWFDWYILNDSDYSAVSKWCLFDFHVCRVERINSLHPLALTVHVTLTEILRSFSICAQDLTHAYLVFWFLNRRLMITPSRVALSGNQFCYPESRFYRNCSKANKSYILYKHHNFYTIINTS